MRIKSFAVTSCWLSLILAGLAFGQGFNNPGAAAALPSAAWGRAWILHANDADGLTDLGFSAFVQTTINDADPLTLAATCQQNRVHDIRWYGALGDPADDSVAVQAAIDAAEAAGSGVVHIPAGTWNFQVTLDAVGALAGAAYPIIEGEGTNGTIIRAIDPNAACIRITGEGHWRYPYVIRDLRIDGVTQDCNGVTVDSENGAFGLYCENVSFTNCDNGFHDRGLIWYQFDFCTFVGCNIGVRLDHQTGGGSHGGCAYFNGCNFSSNQVAGLYSGVAQLMIRDGVVEDNSGFGLFIHASPTLQPVNIENVWFESNGSSASVTIDANAYDPNDRDIYLDGHGLVRFDRLNMPIIYVEAGMTVMARGCTLADGSYRSYIDPNAVLIVTEPVVTTNNASYSRVSKLFSPGATIAPSTSVSDPNDVMQSWRTDPSNEVCSDRANLWSEGSMRIDFTPGNAGIATITFVNSDAPIGGRAVRVAGMTAGGVDATTGVTDLMSTAPTIVEDKWYLFSVDVKSEGDNGYVSLYDRTAGVASGLVALVGHPTDPQIYGWPMYASTDQWRRYVQIRQAPIGGSLDRISLYNPYTTEPTAFLFANMQLVEFATPQEALEYSVRNAVAPGSRIPRTWLVDDPNTTDPVAIVAATDNGKILSNRGGGNATEWDLPAATVGQRYTFVRMAAFSCTIDPSGTNYFRVDGGAGDYLELDTDGDTVTIQCFEAGVWDIVGGYGTYAFEA